ADGVDRLATVRHHVHLMPPFQQHSGRHLLVHDVVFGEQDAQGVARLCDGVTGDEIGPPVGRWGVRVHGPHRFDQIRPRDRLGEIRLDAEVAGADDVTALARDTTDSYTAS